MKKQQIKFSGKVTTRIGLLAFLALLFGQSTLAHNKVVVVPLGSDDAPESKIIFTTQGTWTGDLDGPKGADEKCQAEADAPGSKVTGKKFMAWVSGGLATDFSSTGRRFNLSDLPYVRVDGVQVASDSEDLLDKTISAPLNVSASGSPLSGVGNWTGMTSDGVFVETKDCVAWTSDLISDEGVVGISGAVDGQWSSSIFIGCNQPVFSLICIEK